MSEPADVEGLRTMAERFGTPRCTQTNPFDSDDQCVLKASHEGACGDGFDMLIDMADALPALLDELTRLRAKLTATQRMLAESVTREINLKADRFEVRSRIAEIGDDALGLQPSDAEPIALLDALEDDLSAHRIAAANAESAITASRAEVARLREALRDGVVGLRMTLQLPGPETGITRNVKVVADAMCGVLDDADREAHKATLRSEPAGGEVKAPCSCGMQYIHMSWCVNAGTDAKGGG